MEKNAEQQTEPKEKTSLLKRLKRWLMWLILALIAAGGFYAAYLEKGIPLFDAPQQIDEKSQQNAEQQSSSELSVLKNKVAILEGQIKILSNEITVMKNTPATNEGLVQNIDARLAQIQQTNAAAIEQITQQIKAEQSAEAQTAKPTSQEVLLASGALIVRDMAEQGLPFAYEAEVLQILAQGNSQAEQYVAQAQKFAASGLKGAPALIREFNNLYPALNNMPTIDTAQSVAETAEEPQTWYAKIWQWFKNIAIHRQKMAQPEFNGTEDEVYQQVNAARFAEALNLLKTDSQYTRLNSPALAEWQKQATDYVEFDAAMRALIMNALANIRLQEMQH